MKTTSTHRHRETSRSNRNDSHAAGDLNRNATKNQAEYQRDACEQELYRLRYGIERLLANKEQGDFRDGGSQQQQQQQRYGLSPLGRMRSRMSNWMNSKNKSWFERCTPCCRRWRRKRYENSNIPNEYSSHRSYNDPNNDSTSQMSLKSAPQTPHHNDPFVSPSPSINSNIDRNTSDLKSTNVDINDPVYQSAILKVLEAKALDCLCAGYSKENTRKQISQAVSKINERADGQSHDSASVSSSKLSSGSKSSKQRSKKKSSRSSARSRTPSSSKSKASKRSSSSHRKASPSKHRKASSSKNPKKGSSKHRGKPSSKHRKQPSSAHRKGSKRSKRKPSSSKSKTSKVSSKSPSKRKPSKQHKSKHKKKRRKRTKARSNNQVNDQGRIQLSKPIYSPSSDHVYKNRHRLLQILLSST